MFVMAIVLVPGKIFHPSLMFVSKAGAYPRRCLTRVDPRLAHKQELLTRDKHSSLLGTLVNYGRKKFYNIWAAGYSCV